MDRDGVTIESDRFQLTAAGAEPTQLESVLAELQSTIRGTYGQYCGLSRALEMVGERWGLLIIRDLIVSAKSTTELHQGLPRIPVEVLEVRLREMTHSGVIRPTEELTEGGDQRYELTGYGRALEDVVLAFGRWGAVALAKPRPEDVITADSLMTALRATFLREAARGRAFGIELHVMDVVVHVLVDDGELEVGKGPLPGADAIIDPGPVLLSLFTGQLSAAEALASGMANVTGDPKLLEDFVTIFQLPRIPAPVSA